jgi:hypothetical protein
MAERVSGLESGTSTGSDSELVASVIKGVQDVLEENREHRRRWSDPAAVRARWEELRDSTQVAACTLVFGLHWLKEATAVVSPWW